MPISSIPEKLQQVQDELETESNTLLIPILVKKTIKIRQKNFQVLQTNLSGSNSFILGHNINGKLGVANGLGGGQIVLGSSGSDVTIELIKRRYDWNNFDELNKGTKSSNVDITQGFLQLGNVTVKDIFLEHKEKS